MTNFDLSSYIRWLRPGENSATFHGLTSEDDKLEPTSNYFNLNKEPDFSNVNAFAINNPAISQKHEIIERKMPLSPFSKGTSPTALGLLLKSSMFKDLVEKTSLTPSAGVTK